LVLTPTHLDLFVGQVTFQGPRWDPEQPLPATMHPTGGTDVDHTVQPSKLLEN